MSLVVAPAAFLLILLILLIELAVLGDGPAAGAESVRPATNRAVALNS